MPQSVIVSMELKGLSTEEVVAMQRAHSPNRLVSARGRHVWMVVRDIVSGPMFLLLLAAAALYFVTARWQEGYMTLVAVTMVTAISLYQDVRSNRALEALNLYTRHKVKVMRHGAMQEVTAEELVPGDLILLEEGDTVPADACFLQGNDVSADESLITGESAPVEKSADPGRQQLLQGTTLSAGSCYARVTAIGEQTVLGRLGKSVTGYVPARTLLQQQVQLYVKRLTVFGIMAFILICVANYFRGAGLTESLLMGLTLAMAAIPEEIPVAFSSFMALGAFQLSRLGIITRRPQVMENLGTVSVICLDKTGTITENRMAVAEVYTYKNQRLQLVEEGEDYRQVLWYARMASEKEPFDKMESAIVSAWQLAAADAAVTSVQVFEYPLGGRPPMMTHVHDVDGRLIAAAKGAAERVFRVCRPGDDVVDYLGSEVRRLAAKGYRVLAVAGAAVDAKQLPEAQDDFNWQLYGVVCLNDPPKKGVDKVIAAFYRAGMTVKLLTGDYLETALNIAGRVGISNGLRSLSGEEVMNMTDEQLQASVMEVSIFARMFPEAKERVVKALQAQGELVAMTGDGVNDAPALKAADIGIAMGQRGTTTAREVADIVITDDQLDRLMDAVMQGRKIFTNLKKSVRYIISIHIPIILTAALPVLLGWKYPNIFTPVHIIFLELIMGPTCSIFFEREPVDTAIMNMRPAGRSGHVFSRGEWLTAMAQGLAISAAVLSIYYLEMERGTALEGVRTMVFLSLLFANVFLTFAGRSFLGNGKTLERNNLTPWILGASALFIALLLFVPPVQRLFGLVSLSLVGIMVCAGAAFLAVSWVWLYNPGNTQAVHDLEDA